MEPRIARLELDVAHIRGDIGDIKSSLKSFVDGYSDAKVQLAVLTEQMRHVPSKTHSITVAVALVSAAALVGGFMPQIQSFFQGLLTATP